MRNRHRPRLCGNCRAPMAGDEENCWHCGVEWAENEPRTTLRLVPTPAAGGGSFADDVAAAVRALATK
jgi:predicted amidophosphoribosyltransferase